MSRADVPSNSVQWLYQQIVDNALEASGARYVHLALLDSTRQTARIVAWNHTPMRVWTRAQNLISRFLPGFSPSQIRIPVDPSRRLGRVYYEEAPVVAPLEELAAGLMDPRIARIGATIGRVHFVLACPVRVNDYVVGSLVFGTPKPMSRNQRRVCDAFVRQAALTIERAEERRSPAPRLDGHQVPLVGTLASERSHAGNQEVLEFSGLRLDRSARQVTQDGTVLHLTPTEYNLLETFMNSPRHAFSRRELADKVWAERASQTSNFIDVAVAGLRKKLEADGQPKLIHAVRGHGYALRLDSRSVPPTNLHSGWRPQRQEGGA